MDIILARHGETEWNVGEVFRGRADIDLNRNGRLQAELLGQYLAVTKIEAVYTSPLKRAVDTARSIARFHNLQVEVREELNDLDFGAWEGLSVNEVPLRYPDLFAVWADHPEKVCLPGGETLDDVKKRSMKTIDTIIDHYRESVVLVTHRVVIKVLVCNLLGLGNAHFWNIMVDTCGLTTFRYDKGRFVLIRHNDNGFLKTLELTPSKDF